MSIELYPQCEKCSLHEGVKTYCIPGRGPINAEIYLIGEGPGYEEDKQGKPFVGKASDLLRDEWVPIVGIDLNDCFISNIIKCRPPNNRDPYAREIKACSTFLEHELAQGNPKLIIAVGRIAAKALGLKCKISIDSGKVFTVSDRTVIPLLHPASVLRNPRQIRTFRDSLQRIKAYLDKGHQVEYGEYEVINVEENSGDKE